MTAQSSPKPFFPALCGLVEFFSHLKEMQENELWSRTLKVAAETLGAEAATYYEFNEQVRELVPRYAIGASAGDLPSMVLAEGRGLCVWSAIHREPVIVNDTYHDPRFEKDIDHVTGFETRNLLAFPVIENMGLVGVVELLNSTSGAFSPEDLKFVEAAFRAAMMVSRMLKFERIRDTVASYNASILENLSGGFIASDMHGHVILCNPAARKILLLKPTFPLPLPAEELLMGIPRLQEILLDTLQKKKTVRRAEFDWNFGGQKRVIGYSAILLQDAQGAMTGAGVCFQDISATKKDA